jgi:hypothetical protein
LYFDTLFLVKTDQQLSLLLFFMKNLPGAQFKSIKYEAEDSVNSF